MYRPQAVPGPSFPRGEASGPRTEPVSTTETAEHIKRLTLLNVNHHCREAILEMVLLNRGRRWCDAVIDHEVSPLRLQTQRMSEKAEKVPRYKVCKHRIHIGNVSVLLVCRQLWSEGTQILYGRNSFVSYNFPQLKHSLPTVIGARNMALIRRVTLGLPMKHKRSDPIVYLGGFLEFLNEKLPRLSELTLTSEFFLDDRPFLRNGANTRIGEEYRAMLNTSAWVTCRHQRLKKAIWIVESGGVWSTPLPTSKIALGLGWNLTEDDWDGESPESICYCRLTVKILAEDQRFKPRTQLKTDPLSAEENAVARDILLDCRAIRRAGWSSLISVAPQDFALAGDATSSESPRTLVRRTEDGLLYADWQTVNDHLRDRFKYLSLRDKSRLTRKRVVERATSAQKGPKHEDDL